MANSALYDLGISEREREIEMTKQMTAAERREYYSAEATDRRTRTAQNLISEAWWMAGGNGIKIPLSRLESALIGGPSAVMDYDEFTTALQAHVDANHIHLHDDGTFTTNL